MARKIKTDKNGKPLSKPIAENRRARYEFAIEETFEAGISLLGTGSESSAPWSGQYRGELRLG